MTDTCPPEPRLYKRRVWSKQLRGYTYDNVNLTKCQCYPMCAEGKREQAAHEQRLKEQNER